ncbi:hypothetical protein UFOVP134_56 [uncultured Caudovirales phage]|uniref:Uncharacterized protein n=1 Tax=uncultured Caudovirales phage TaxID=2100421 RepID=A0A6J5LH07_9CAUD|nr:hypothetical protein UFOVP134_56 [uncultured Caudovirales phage]
MRATESFQLGFTTQTSTAVTDGSGQGVSGGYYQLAAVSGAWNSASLQLQQLAPDGSTWLSVGSAVTANGVQLIYLPGGQYQMTVSVGTPTDKIYVALTRVPLSD